MMRRLVQLEAATGDTSIRMVQIRAKLETKHWAGCAFKISLDSFVVLFP